MATNAEKEFDIIIFGATGFTGKYVVEYVAKISKDQLKWAVAGRSANKLAEVLAEVSVISGKDINHVTIIEADVGNDESLENMCKRTKLIVNCVGPYRFYGEPVVKACVQNGSHHVDISGETEYLEKMQLKYHDQARTANVYIVGNVGYDSIPCEMGIQFLQANFNGDVNSVDVFYNIKFGPEKTKLNFGTFHSLIHHVAHENELKSLRRKLFVNPLPKSNHSINSRSVLTHSSEINKWCIRFPTTDESAVSRTQYYNYHHRKLRPVYTQASSYYMVLPNLFLGILLIIVFPLGLLMMKLSWGRRLLINYPSFFTLGAFSKKGPSRTQVENSSFETTVVGTGYETKLTNYEDKHTDKPKKKMVVKVSGPEPAYIATPICMIQAALTILQETDKLPETGGVYSPGAAFLNTTLVTRLSKEGISFEVVNK